MYTPGYDANIDNTGKDTLEKLVKDYARQMQVLSLEVRNQIELAPQANQSRKEYINAMGQHIAKLQQHMSHTFSNLSPEGQHKLGIQYALFDVTSRNAIESLTQMGDLPQAETLNNDLAKMIDKFEAFAEQLPEHLTPKTTFDQIDKAQAGLGEVNATLMQLRDSDLGRINACEQQGLQTLEVMVGAEASAKPRFPNK